MRYINLHLNYMHFVVTRVISGLHHVLILEHLSNIHLSIPETD